MSGLSNWALNQRIYSVAARSRGGGSTNSTISDVLGNGNDAGNKAITNLSNITSSEVTTSKVKSTAALELESNGNKVTIGTTGKLTLPNPSGEGILCKDSSDTVEKVTVGSNLAYNTTSKKLDLAADLTGLTSVTSDGVTTNKITFPPQLLQNANGTSNLGTSEQYTNLENLFRISILDKDNTAGGKTTAPSSGGLLIVDSNGRVTISQTHTNLSVNAGSQTISASNPAAYDDDSSPAIYMDSGKTYGSTNWDKEMYYRRNGSQLWFKGKLTYNTTLPSFTYKITKDDSLTENYFYSDSGILNLFEYNTTSESNLDTGLQLGNTRLGAKENYFELTQGNPSSIDYDIDNQFFYQQSNDTIEVYETISNINTDVPRYLSGNLIDNQNVLQPFFKIPCTNIDGSWSLSYKMFIILSQWSIYIFEVGNYTNSPTFSFENYHLYSDQLPFSQGMTLIRSGGLGARRHDLGLGGFLHTYTFKHPTGTYTNNNAGRSAFGDDMVDSTGYSTAYLVKPIVLSGDTDVRNPNLKGVISTYGVDASFSPPGLGNNIKLTETVFTEVNRSAIYDSADTTWGPNTVVVDQLEHQDENENGILDPTGIQVATEMSATVQGVYTRYATITGSPTFTADELYSLKESFYMKLPETIQYTNPYAYPGQFLLIRSDGSFTKGNVRYEENTDKDLLYLTEDGLNRYDPSWAQNDIVEFDCMMEVNP